MFSTNFFIVFISFLNIIYCDWVADWMSPVQDQLRQSAAKKLMQEDVVKMMKYRPELMEKMELMTQPPPKEPGDNLKTKLEQVLRQAEDFINQLQSSIYTVETTERKLKEAIANGRSGVTAVTVSLLDQTPRQYLVREGLWTRCQGMLQYPMVGNQKNLLYDIFAEPRCIGTEMPAKQDPCVFNSIIKYEVIPERRKIEYTEDDVFCLKPMFNKSLEQYHSVPKKVVDATCKSGVVRKLDEQLNQCGMRVMTEYSYYPKKTLAASQYPLEYCTEKDGSCKLIVAWHLSNTTVENFEFLKNDPNFKKYFITPSASPRQMLIE